MEVIKDDRPPASGLQVNNLPGISLDYLILLYVPGCEAPSLMLKHMYAVEAGGPVIEVHLVAKFAIFQPVITPFKAAIGPPAERS
jgi:hypothetical protein